MRRRGALHLAAAKGAHQGVHLGQGLGLVVGGGHVLGSKGKGDLALYSKAGHCSAEHEHGLAHQFPAAQRQNGPDHNFFPFYPDANLGQVDGRCAVCQAARLKIARQAVQSRQRRLIQLRIGLLVGQARDAHPARHDLDVHDLACSVQVQAKRQRR